MDLQHEGEATLRNAGDLVEAFDDVQLPQRLREVERAGVQPGSLDAELAPVARLGQRDVAHVVLEVELLVLHPVRVIEVGGNPHHLLTEGPGQVQPGLEVGQDALERHRSTGRGGGVVDADRCDVRRRVRPLAVDERRILSTELLHVRPPDLAPRGKSDRCAEESFAGTVRRRATCCGVRARWPDAGTRPEPTTGPRTAANRPLAATGDRGWPGRWRG